jgi:hypothetical protein
VQTKCVLLVESGQFIGGVIGNLFSRFAADLKLVEIFPANGAELISAVKTHQPQVVVLDDTLNERFLAQLLHFMQTSEALRVLVVNANSNKVSVYQKQQIPLSETADFFALF